MDFRDWLQQQSGQAESGHVQDLISYVALDLPKKDLRYAPDRPAHARKDTTGPVPTHLHYSQEPERLRQRAPKRIGSIPSYASSRLLHSIPFEATRQPCTSATRSKHTRRSDDEWPYSGEAHAINDIAQERHAIQRSLHDSERREYGLPKSRPIKSERKEDAMTDTASFQKRARRKTREAIYEFGSGVRRRRASRHDQQRQPERAGLPPDGNFRKDRTGRGLRLLNDFKPPNVFSGRLTMDQHSSVGLFRKGRASSPVNGRKSENGFSELEFLGRRAEPNVHARRQRPITAASPGRQLREKSESDISGSEVDAYFSGNRKLLDDPDLERMPDSGYLEGHVAQSISDPDEDMLDQGPTQNELHYDSMRQRHDIVRRHDHELSSMDVENSSESPSYRPSPTIDLHHPSPERFSEGIGARMDAEARRSSRLPNPKGLFDSVVSNASSWRSRAKESSGSNAFSYR